MKRFALVCLGAVVALLAACGGSEQPTGDAGQASAANLTFKDMTEAQDYLLDHYPEDKLKEMYVEFAALSVADTEHYYKKDDSGGYEELDDATANAIIDKMNKNIDAVIKRFGISRPLYSALMLYVRTTDWPMTMDEQVKARAEEINANRSDDD